VIFKGHFTSLICHVYKEIKFDTTTNDAETSNDTATCSSSSYPLVSFQFPGVIVSLLGNFAQVRTETQTANMQPFPVFLFFPQSAFIHTETSLSLRWPCYS